MSAFFREMARLLADEAILWSRVLVESLLWSVVVVPVLSHFAFLSAVFGYVTRLLAVETFAIIRTFVSVVIGLLVVPIVVLFVVLFVVRFAVRASVALFFLVSLVSVVSVAVFSLSVSIREVVAWLAFLRTVSGQVTWLLTVETSLVASAILSWQSTVCGTVSHLLTIEALHFFITCGHTIRAPANNLKF